MAVGTRLLAKQKAIVTRLVAIEELAGVDVLCADKTCCSFVGSMNDVDLKNR